MTIYSVTVEQMTENANRVKETVLRGLEAEGLLTKPAKEIGEHYAVVLHKKNWLGALWSRWFSSEEKGAIEASFVKIVTRKEGA